MAKRFPSLTSDDVAVILAEVMNGEKASKRSKEALSMRRLLTKQVKALRSKGLEPGVPVEWSGDQKTGDLAVALGDNSSS